jgi:hypothetical protein
MRRKTWWALCALDIRAAENQGTDLSIAIGSFHTKFALNITEADIEIGTQETPPERHGLTDMTIAVTWYAACDTVRQILAPGTKDGPSDLQRQNRMLEELNEKLEQDYFRHSTELGNIAHYAGAIVFFLMKSKLTLLIYFQFFFPRLAKNSRMRFGIDC